MPSLLQDLKVRLGDRPDLALRLWILTIILITIFLASALNSALPLRLLDPRWLQVVIQALLSNGFLPLIALACLHLAVVLHPKSSRLRRRRDRFSKLAYLPAIGFLLLIPLQIAATWGSVNMLAAGQQQQRLQSAAMISAVRQAASTASSHQDFDQSLRTLPIAVSGPPSAAELALPFPERRRRILEGLQRSEQQLTSVRSPAPIPWLALLEASLRVVPTAVALAAGYAVMAVGSGGS